MHEKSQNLNPPTRRVYRNKNADKIPVLFLLMGLPGSGKSTLANELYVGRDTESKPAIFSSDALRLEMFGDEDDQEHNEEVFNELRNRIKASLRDGNDVIYDATNISKKRRIAFIKDIGKLSCFKVCISVMTPYDFCLKSNKNRERVAPEDVVNRMYLNWNPPSFDEGFDDVVLAYRYESDEERNKFTLDNFFTGDIQANNIPQENSHHSYTIGDHCRKTGAYLLEKYPEETILHTAGLLHDVGKVFTKSPLNSKGENDGEYHYYNHQCVGAYDSLFYTDVLELSINDSLELANLIYYHMMPFTTWKDSKRKENKDRNLIGEVFFNKVMKLHEADLCAR